MAKVQWAGLVMSMLGAASVMAQRTFPGPPAQPKGVPVDWVVATVNDSAILMSNVVTIAESRIKGFVREHGAISPADRKHILEGVLQNEVDDLRLALAAKSFGVLTPEQIDQHVQAELEHDRQLKQRDFGSYTEFSQELKRTNRTLQAYEQEQRADKLRRVAGELTVGRRIGGRINLWVTPRMLLETYHSEQYHARFVHPASARVVQVRFHGKDAAEQAKAAAAQWRQTEIDARQLASRFPGSIAIGELSAEDSLQNTLPEMAAFALAGPEGAVSEPVPFQGDFLVGRVTSHTPARNGRFEDPEVQTELRDLCFDRVVKELRQEGMQRTRERTEVWPPQLAR